MSVLYVQRSGSKVIAFAVSAKFEILLLDCWQVESEFWLAKLAIAD